jgi:hypothetical protein
VCCRLDSWWYPKDTTGGVTLWEPTSEVFPSGMSDWLGETTVLHNRWFSPVADYITSGNFTGDFVIEELAAVPVRRPLFDYIMGRTKAWGMFTYEQDWLSYTYNQMLAPRANVTVGRDWLYAMGDAATGLGLTVQYCMPLPVHILQSTKIPAVTQIRASDDYRPYGPPAVPRSALTRCARRGQPLY